MRHSDEQGTGSNRSGRPSGNPPSGNNGSARQSSTSDNGEFSAAMTRLESAVQDIVSVTTGQISDRATSLLDDTSKRLEAELRLRRMTQDPEVDQRQSRRRRRSSFRHRLVDRAERINPRSGRLYRDPENEKIGGVCAGVARYFGMQTWAVRLGALTGLLFIPTIVFPAYWIAYFIMDTPAKGDEPERKKRKGRRRSRSPDSGRPRGAGAVGNEPPQPYVAGRQLRYTGADLTEAELRLRRLESFVTSDQYELQKELAKIESETEPHRDR